MGKKKCIICGTTTEDPLNLGEMKSFQNISAHYYCLLLASTIKQSGEDDDGILGFLPSDIKDEVKAAQKRICVYCKRKGATVLCNGKHCKAIFHLPCGILNESGHQFHGRFQSFCSVHRAKQKFKKPAEPQSCPICYDTVDFSKWAQILWAPCCKKQSFFHKSCIQQMALSAGYFFKCPICNNTNIFQKTMKNYGVFIPDRDASWELEPNAFEELLYRHTECNAKICLCKSGRQYDNLGPWNIVLCSLCGSQGTHIQCSNLEKNKKWICDSCFIEKKSDTIPATVTNQSGSKQINEVQLIPSLQPSTSGIQNSELPTNTNSNNNALSTTNQSQRNKRKRNWSLRSSTIMKDVSDLKNPKNDSTFIEIDSEDSDVVIIEDEPSSKCLIAQDGSLLKVRNINQQTPAIENLEIENQDNSSCKNFMNLVITDVRSLSKSNDDFIENKIPAKKPFNTIDVSNEEFKMFQHKMMLPLTAMTDQQQQQQQHQFMVLQEVIYNNNISAHQNMENTNSNSSDDVVIID